MKGHWRTGLSSALDGSDDHEICREARLFWDELGMATLRAEAIAEVNKLVDSKELETMEQWRSLIRHPEDPGVMHDEGAELESVKQDGEILWETDADLAVVAADDHDTLHAMDTIPAKDKIAPKPGDDPKAVEDANAALAKLKVYKAMRRTAARRSLPAVSFLLDKEIRQIERGVHCGGRAHDQHVNTVLQRHVADMLDTELKHVRVRQASAAKTRKLQAKVKAAARKVNAKKLKAKKEKVAFDAKLAALPKEFTAKSCADVVKGYDARRDCLERLRLKSPKLPPDLAVKWVDVQNEYAKTVPTAVKTTTGKTNYKAWGNLFISDVNKLLKALGNQYKGPTPHVKKAPKVGDADAFATFVRKMDESLGHGASVLLA